MYYTNLTQNNDILNYCCTKDIISHKIKQTKSLKNLTCHLPDQFSSVNSLNYVSRKNLKTKCFKYIDNINELNCKTEYDGFAYPSKDDNIIISIKKNNSIVYITSEKYFQSRLKHDINVFDKLSVEHGKNVYLTDAINIEKEYSVLILENIGSPAPNTTKLNVPSKDLNNVFVLIVNKISKPVIIEGIEISERKLFARLDNCWYSFNADFVAKFNDNISDIIDRQDSKKIIFINIDGKDKKMEKETYIKYNVMFYSVINFENIKYLCVNQFKVLNSINNNKNIFYLKNNKSENLGTNLNYSTLEESKKMLELDIIEITGVPELLDFLTIKKYTEIFNTKNGLKISVEDMKTFINPSKNFELDYLWNSRKIFMPNFVSNTRFENLLARKKKIMSIESILNLDQTDAGSTLYSVYAYGIREYISLILKFLCFYDYDTFINVTRWRFNFFTLMNSDEKELKILIFDKNNIWNEYKVKLGNKVYNQKCPCEIMSNLFDIILDVYCEYFGSDYSYGRKFFIIYAITGIIPIYIEYELGNLIDKKVEYDIFKVNLLCKDTPTLITIKETNEKREGQKENGDEELAKKENDEKKEQENEKDTCNDLEDSNLLKTSYYKDILAISEDTHVFVHVSLFDYISRLRKNINKIWIPRLNLNNIWKQNCLVSIETSEFNNKHTIKINSPDNVNSTTLYRLSIFYFSSIENEIYFCFNKYFNNDDSVLNIPFYQMTKIHHCPATFYFEIKDVDHFFLIIKSINSQCTISLQLYYYNV